ncbi:MAG: hypothetical protein U0Q15_11540 [Kineosporiaceae bacterium]
MSDVLHLADDAAAEDLATFVRRAKALDADGAIRLRAHGAVLATYVSPVHGGGGPTVLALRTLALNVSSDLDATVSLAAMTDRFARAVTADVPVPPTRLTGVAWAGVTPPRRGWEVLTPVASGILRDLARSGAAEIAAACPEGSGAAAVATVRGTVWGRPLSDGIDVPTGVAYAADTMGFLPDGEQVTLLTCGAWSRLSTSRGHVIARAAGLL